MSEDYYTPSGRRKSKKDKKMKWKYGIYKKGGKYRASGVKEGGKNK